MKTLSDAIAYIWDSTDINEGKGFTGKEMHEALEKEFPEGFPLISTLDVINEMLKGKYVGSYQKNSSRQH